MASTLSDMWLHWKWQCREAVALVEVEVGVEVELSDEVELCLEIDQILEGLDLRLLLLGHSRYWVCML